MAGWLETFAQPFLTGLGHEARRDVIDEVC
jgi:hypothetical protein